MESEEKGKEIMVQTKFIYNDGIIVHEIKTEKYSDEIKETFVFENQATKERFKIRKDKLLNIIRLLNNKNEVDYKIYDGWQASGSMPAGSGLGVRIIKDIDSYNFIFLTSRLGNKFSLDMIIRKDYIKIEKKVIETIFEYLTYCKKINDEKEEQIKQERENMDFGNM